MSLRRTLQEQKRQAGRASRLVRRHGREPFDARIKEFLEWNKKWQTENAEYSDAQEAHSSAFDKCTDAEGQVKRLRAVFCKTNLKKDARAWDRAKESHRNALARLTECRDCEEAAPSNADDNPFTRLDDLAASTETDEPGLLCLQFVLVIVFYEQMFGGKAGALSFIPGGTLWDVPNIKEDWTTWRGAVDDALAAVGAKLSADEERARTGEKKKRKAVTPTIRAILKEYPELANKPKQMTESVNRKLAVEGLEETTVKTVKSALRRIRQKKS